MIRREFLRLLGVLPFAGLIKGKNKPPDKPLYLITYTDNGCIVRIVNDERAIKRIAKIG